jgi:hypothetical protein
MVWGYGSKGVWGERMVLAKAIKMDSRRAAELAGKDIILLRLNPDLVRFSLRSLRL